MADPFLEMIEEYVRAWHGIGAPNDTGRRLAMDLAGTIRAFEAQRGRLVFEDEPSGFEQALLDERDAP